MRPPLVRFGVAIDEPLLTELDRLVVERGCTRSEMFRDLARAEVVRAKVTAGVDAVAALTIVYDHHVRDLSEKLTELQHSLGDGVRSAMHVHLSHDYCLEVIVIRGRSDELQAVAHKILGMRGVKHGGIEIVSDIDLGYTPTHRHGHAHGHDGHGHADDTHAHARAHSHPHTPQPTTKRAAKPIARRPAKTPRRRRRQASA